MENLFTHIPLNSDTQNQVNALALEVEQAFNLLEDYLYLDNSFHTALSPSVGDLKTNYIKNYTPNNGIISNYSQNLIFPLDSKEASLDLIPSTLITDLDAVTIVELGNPSAVYQYKHDGFLVEETDFTFVNKKVVFKNIPINQLQITYSGSAVIDGAFEDKIRQNLVSFSGVSTFACTEISSNTYRVSGYDFKDFCSPAIQTMINNAENITPYFSVYDELGVKQQLVSINSVTNTTITFEVTAGSDVLTDVQILVMNTSIGTLLEGLYKLIYTHNHSTTEGVNVNHKDLLGLFTNTSDINYIHSNKENYDHPQFLNREGFIEDPTVYNNAILGDVLIASTDDTNYYNNIEDDSNKLIFGSASNGIKIYFDKSAEGLVFDSAEDKNGLVIKTGKNKTSLKINNNLLTDRKLLDDTTFLELALEKSNVNSTIGILKLVKKVVDEFTNEVTVEDSAKLFVRYAEIGIVTVKEELKIPTSNSKITFGDPALYSIKLNPTTSYLEFNKEQASDLLKVEFKTETKHSKISTNTLIAENFKLDNEASKITFGPSTESIKYIGTQLTIDSNKSTNFKNNGYRSGLSLDNRYYIYASALDGAPVGALSNSGVNLYIEAPLNGQVHFIKDIGASFIEGNTLLTSAPKADIYASTTTVSEVFIQNTTQSITGVNLDMSQNNTIFANKNASGNSSTVFKTNGSFVFTNSYQPSIIGSPLISYGVIEAGEVKTKGDKDTTAGFYGNVFIPIDNKIVIDGPALFNSAISFTNKVNITNELIAEKVTAKDVVADTAEVKGTFFVKTIDADAKEKSRFGDLEVRESLEVSKAIIQNSSTARNVFNGELRVVGKTELLSGLDMSSSLITNLINSTEPSADEAVSYGLLKYENGALEETLTTAIDLKISQAIQAIIEKAYPIGTLYFNSANNSNPSIPTLLGIGTWARDLVGEVPVGFSENGLGVPSWVTYFDTPFGAYEHTLTIDQMPAHRHRYMTDDSAGDPHTGRTRGADMTNKGNSGPAREAFTNLDYPNETGNNQPHNNVQPSRVIAIWRRVS